MKVTTRNNGADIAIEVDGKQVDSFEHISGSLHEAQLQADAYARGVVQGIALAKASHANTASANADDDQAKDAPKYVYFVSFVADGQHGNVTYLLKAPWDEKTHLSFIKGIRKQEGFEDVTVLNFQLIKGPDNT